MLLQKGRFILTFICVVRNRICFHHLLSGLHMWCSARYEPLKRQQQQGQVTFYFCYFFLDNSKGMRQGDTSDLNSINLATLFLKRRILQNCGGIFSTSLAKVSSLLKFNQIILRSQFSLISICLISVGVSNSLLHLNRAISNNMYCICECWVIDLLSAE